jgi:hypothetical protein
LSGIRWEKARGKFICSFRSHAIKKILLAAPPSRSTSNRHFGFGHLKVRPAPRYPQKAPQHPHHLDVRSSRTFQIQEPFLATSHSASRSCSRAPNRRLDTALLDVRDIRLDCWKPCSHKLIGKQVKLLGGSTPRNLTAALRRASTFFAPLSRSRAHCLDGERDGYEWN